MISKHDYDWNAFKTQKQSKLRHSQSKEKYYNNLIHKSNDPKDAWKTINSIFWGAINPIKPTTFSLKVESKDIEMPDEVTECFRNDFFSGIGSI